MVHTRNQLTKMNSQENSERSEQTEQTQDDTVNNTVVETIPPRVTDGVQSTSSVVPTEQTSNNTDTRNSWFQRFELILTQMSQQMATKSDLDSKFASVANDIESRFEELSITIQKNISKDIQDQQQSMLGTINQKFDDLESKQQEIVQNMVTREEIEARFTKLETVQQQISTHVTNEITKQLQTRVVHEQKQIDKRFNALGHQLSVQLTQEVHQKLGSVTSEVESIKQTVKDLPVHIDDLTHDISNLRTEQETLKNSVTRITYQAENIVKDQQVKLNDFLQSTEAQINEKLETELGQVVQGVAEKVYERHGVSVRSIQQELSNVKAMIETGMTQMPQPTHTPNSDLPSEWTPSPGHKNTPENLTSTSRSQTQQSTPLHSQHHVEIGLPAPIRCSKSHESVVANLMLEDSLIKHHQFQVFIPENRTVHPVIFIKSFREVLPKSWSERQRIRFAAGYIQGEGALWALETSSYCNTFHEFESAFLSKFWSAGMQERLRNEVYNPRPFNVRKGNLRRYFEKYLNKTRFFDDPISHREVLRILKGKLPSHIRRELFNVPDYNLDEFLSTVDALDLIYEDDRGGPSYNDNINGQRNGGNANQLIPVRPPSNNQNFTANSRQGFVDRAPQQSPPAVYQGGGGGNYNRNTQNYNYNNGRGQDNRFHPGYQNHNRNTWRGQNRNASYSNDNNGNNSWRNGSGPPNNNNNGRNFPVAQITRDTQNTRQSGQNNSGIVITEVVEGSSQSMSTQTTN